MTIARPRKNGKKKQHFLISESREGTWSVCGGEMRMSSEVADRPRYELVRDRIDGLIQLRTVVGQGETRKVEIGTERSGAAQRSGLQRRRTRRSR